jgi:hypothetical protein
MRNAFLLKNERKTFEMIECLLYGKVFGFPFFDEVNYCPYPCSLVFLSCEWLYRARKFRSRKKRLKSRCTRQPIRRNTPPQEQGTRFQKPASTRLMYPVKSSSNTRESTNPFPSVFGNSNSPAANSSANGSRYSKVSATSLGKDWLRIWPRKVSKSAILLKAA